MAVIFSNNAKTTLASNVSASATSISVVDGSVFPVISGSDYAYVTFEDIDGNVEIVKVTALSSNTLTVVRAQDNTSARAFSTADKCELRLTAAGLNEVASQADTDTNTTYSIGDGGLTTNDFTNADHSKLNAIEASANNYALPSNIAAASLDISGNVDVDGITNLDVVDIDGAVDMASTLAVGGQTIISSNALVATPSTYYDELVVQNSASGTGAGITILVNATNGYGGVKFGDSTNSNQFGIGFDANANTGFLDVLGGQALTIDSSRNIGIGTASPSVPLTVNNNTDHSDIAIFHAGGGTPNRGLKISTFSNTNSNAGVELDAQHSTGAFKFSTGGTERMRIDSSGNLLVGTTNINPSQNAVEGIALSAGSYGGYLSAARSGGVVAQFARLTNDGAILDFRNSTGSAGSIGTLNSDLTIGSGDTGLRFNSANDFILPFNTTTNASRDAAIDLGLSTTRFRDLHLSGNANVGGLDVTGTTTGSGYLYLSSKTANQGLRLNNTTKIQAWNPAGTVLRSLMQLDANEDVRIGSSANDIYLDNDTTVTGATTINANVASPLTVNANLNGIAYNEVFNVNAGANAAAYFGIVTLNLANTGTIRSGMFFDSSNHLNFINGEAGGAGIVLHDNNAVTMSGSLSVAGKYNITRGDITIAAGAITPTTSYVRLDTQASAATDDLDTINGGVIGDIVILETRISSRDVVVKDGTGNLGLAGGADFTLVNKSSTITLIYDGTSWLEMSRSSN